MVEKVCCIHYSAFIPWLKLDNFDPSKWCSLVPHILRSSQLSIVEAVEIFGVKAQTLRSCDGGPAAISTSDLVRPPSRSWTGTVSESQARCPQVWRPAGGKLRLAAYVA